MKNQFNIKSISLILILSILLLFILSLTAVARAETYYEDKVAVLMYHHIDPLLETSATIKPDLFEDQIKYLVKVGYNFISMNQLNAFLNDQGKVPKNAILVTFDDGYRSYYDYAYPILKEYNIPSTNFIIGEMIGVEYGIARLTGEDITELSQDSLVDFQSHSFAMHKKTNESLPLLVTRLPYGDFEETIDQHSKRITTDLTNNMKSLESLTAKKVISFAYPFGSYSSDSIQVLKDTGHQLAFTIKNGMANQASNPLLLPRVNAGNPDISPEQLHTNILDLNQKSLIINKNNILVGPDIYISGKLVVFPAQQPFIFNNMTYVHVRTIAEEFGSTVTWDSIMKKAIICDSKNQEIELEENNRVVKKTGGNIVITAPPIIYKGSMMVPIRFVNNIYGKYVDWDGLNKRVYIR